MSVVDRLRASEAPLPLGEVQAIQQAYKLRCKFGLSYNAIVQIMGEYHGEYRSENNWRLHCKQLGAPAKRPGQLTPQDRRRLAA